MKMKVLQHSKRRERPDPQLDPEAAIRLYRRHAARALAEERWCVAEIFINRIIETAPRRTEAWLTKGWIRQHCRHDEATALECYQRVIEILGHDERHPHVQRAKKSLGKIIAAAV